MAKVINKYKQVMIDCLSKLYRLSRVVTILFSKKKRFCFAAHSCHTKVIQKW